MFKKKKINDNIEYLANYNGLNKVSNLVIEECSELIKELTKLNRNIGNLDNVKEEKCDDCKYNTHNKCLLDEAIMAYEKKDLEKVEEIINGCKK